MEDGLDIAKRKKDFERWSAFSSDVQSGLNEAAPCLIQNQAGGLWDSNTVAVRILLRTCSNFHAVRSLVSIDLVSEPRSHVRSIIEGAFALVWLRQDPNGFLDGLKNDAAASSKRQSGFIMNHFELPDGDRTKSIKSLAESKEKFSPLKWRDMAERGPYARLYLAYLQLSESSVHLSARSLHRYSNVKSDCSSWSYSDGKGTYAENAATLKHACSAAISVGMAISDLLNDASINASFGALSEKFGQMPKTIGLLDDARSAEGSV